MSMVFMIIAGIVLMVPCILVLPIIMRRKNTPRADGSIPSLGDADLFSGQPLQRSKRKSTTKPAPKPSIEEDIFKVPDSTF